MDPKDAMQGKGLVRWIREAYPGLSSGAAIHYTKDTFGNVERGQIIFISSDYVSVHLIEAYNIHDGVVISETPMHKFPLTDQGFLGW